MRKALVAGNWKMNGRAEVNRELLRQLQEAMNSELPQQIDVLVCPPAVYLADVVRQLEGSGVDVGAQNLCEYGDGAYTGEISAGMLLDVGCRAVIIGHSERRALFGDSDERVAIKVVAAVEAGLTPVLCVGETLAERDAEQALDVVERQVRDGISALTTERLEKLVLAYEPVWAIGTGRTATPEQAQEVHSHIRAVMRDIAGENLAQSVRILYGGSVNASNAEVLFGQPDIDGGLVGGASLKANEFIAICQAAVASLNG